MRCSACNQELSDYETSFSVNGEPLNICMDCLDYLDDVAKDVEANANLASEADFK